MLARSRVNGPARIIRRLAPAAPAFMAALVVALTSQSSFAHDGSLGGDREAAASLGRADVEIEGTLEVLHEHLIDGSSRYRHTLKTKDGATLRLKGVGTGRDLLTGDRVRVRGAASGEALQLQAMDGETLELLQYAPIGATFGVQKVVVLLVNNADDARRPYTVAQAQEALAAVDSFYREASYDQTSLDVDVFGWYTLPTSSTTCSTSQIRTYAQQAATAAGVDLSQYARQVYAFPQNANCAFSGVATVGGSPSSAWINGNTLSPHLVAHEIGHNYGLYHSHALRCTPGVLGTSCSALEYGDVVDMMGSTGHFNAFQKQRLGWLDYGVSPPITAVQTSGTYTIETYEVPGTGPKALRIPRGTSGQSFFLELRNKIGWDANVYQSGVYVRLATDADPNSSYLLDMTPETASFAADAVLDVGASFTDPAWPITVTTLSVTSSSATIRVDVGTSCARANPIVVASPEKSPDVPSGTMVSYNVFVTNKDSSACPASSFSLQATAPAGWTKLFSAPSVTVAPGATASARLDVASSAVPPGSYSVTGTAISSTASTLAGSDSVIYSVVSSSGGSGGGAAGTFTDTFDRPDAPTLGNGWVTAAGTLAVKAGQASAPPAQGIHAVVQPTLAGAMHTATAQFTSPGNTRRPRFGLFARYVGPGNYYACYRQTGSSSALRIARVVNGTEKILAAVHVPNPSRGVPFTIGCQVTGTTITASLGATTIAATDPTLSSGTTGFFLGNRARGGALELQADDFHATVQ